MTMPHERVRALRWGFEFLGELVDDCELPDPQRMAARALLLTHPTPEQLAQLMTAADRGLPDDWGTALCAAGDLFELIWWRGLGSVKLRESLRFVRRHYPDASTVRAMTKTKWLHDWLLPEDQYR